MQGPHPDLEPLCTWGLGLACDMGVMDEEQALSSQMMSESQASEGQGGVNLSSPACAPHTRLAQP